MTAGLDGAKVPAEVLVYECTFHGWTVRDMPKQADGAPTYNPPDAERAFNALLALYKNSIA